MHEFEYGTILLCSPRKWLNVTSGELSDWQHFVSAVSPILDITVPNYFLCSGVQLYDSVLYCTYCVDYSKINELRRVASPERRYFSSDGLHGRDTA